MGESVDEQDAVAQGAYARYRGVRYFGSLDGLRCISILAVIWHHTCGRAYCASPWLNILGMGYMGVDLFFVISGFLITTLLLRERDRSGAISLRRFYARRALRIFPLYYGVLAAYVLLVMVFEGWSPAGRGFFGNLPWFATYTSNWFMKPGPGSHRIIFVFAWSLAAEEQFYLCWPAVLKYLGSGRALFVLLLAVAVDQVLSMHLGVAVWGLSAQLLRIITSFSTQIALGVFVAMALHSRRVFAVAYRWFGGRWASLAVLGLAGLAISLPVATHRGLRDMFVLPFALLVLTCVIREDHCLAWALKLRVVRNVGIVSYGMYLMHRFGTHLVTAMLARMGIASSAFAFLLIVPCTFGLAALSYRHYESVFLRLKGKLVRSGPETSKGPPMAVSGP